jgi:predicted RNase H-like nuclease (RuvC/YqgF family)
MTAGVFASYVVKYLIVGLPFSCFLQAKNLSTNSSVPKATIGDYSRRGSRGDSDFLRNENKYLQEDVEKYKAQCVKLNEEIEHLHDRLAEADKKASRLAREKDELSRSMNGEPKCHVNCTS